MLVYMNFSVLISVYYKEQPYFLRQSLDSIFAQTLLPNEVVLVKDGPLSKELDEVVEEFCSQHTIIKVISLNHNQGLGKALNEGLKHCSYNLVARMDTDDICKKNRFEEQIKIFKSDSSIDVVGSNIDEFIGNIENIISSRKLPELHYDIVKYAKKRSPLNHPTVMFKKNSVIASGGYLHMYLLEDYYLWMRMISKGCKFYNIQDSLLYFRTSENMIKRRGGYKYVKSEIRFYIVIYKLGFIGFFDLISNILIRSFVRLSPNVIRSLFYRTFLR